MRRCLVVKRAASSCQMWTQRHVYLPFVQKQTLKTSSSFHLKTTTTNGRHSNGAQPQQHYKHSLIHCDLCVTGVEVVAKMLSVLVHSAFPAFSGFKLIIYYNDYLNINLKKSPLCELISCDHPDVTQKQIREATESTESPTELFYILGPFFSSRNL